MTNKIQPRPGDGADEETIEKNLKEMEYNPKDDIMRQGDVVEEGLGDTDKQAFDNEQPSKEK